VAYVGLFRDFGHLDFLLQSTLEVEKIIDTPHDDLLFRIETFEKFSLFFVKLGIIFDLHKTGVFSH